ncbi:MAG: ABC transporter permease subunit [Lachnospiraceae bacterium]|nr:ABC transporter permease subunit [Lachnospiraceae bacterium]
MIAVLKHELRSTFNSLTIYLFSAALLCFVGVGAMIYNIQASIASFEYVLGFISVGLVVIIPVLTMRCFSEERKQKTDQLLYALPLKTWQIVVGKYLSLLIMFLLPMVIICVYPYIFSKYGEVYLPGAYGAIFAFFCMGAALISIGMFISSLTENQGFAAGIAIVVFLFNYFSVTLAEQVSKTAIGSLIAILVLAAVIGFIVRALTRNNWIAGGVGGGLIALAAAAYFIWPNRFEGLLPNIMKKLSLFSRFEIFVNGIFDLTALVFYASVIILGIFLTIQSLEKRRYN